MLRASYEGCSPETSVFILSPNNRPQISGDVSLVSCSEVEPSVKKYSLVVNPVQASCFRSELLRSRRYAKHVFKHFRKMYNTKPDVIAVEILLTPVVTHSIDYRL